MAKTLVLNFSKEINIDRLYDDIIYNMPDLPAIAELGLTADDLTSDKLVEIFEALADCAAE